MSVPLATLEVMSASADNPEGTIAFVTRDFVNASTFMAFFHSDFRGRQLNRVIVQGGILPSQRNECVQRMKGDFLIFIDDDMVWQPTALADLIESYEELKRSNQFSEPFMLGALCFRRTAPFQPTLYMRESPTEGAYNFLEEWDDGIVEVDATGCAFLLVPVEVFEAVADTPLPPFEERMKMTRPPEFFSWYGHIGEDLRFCQDAKAAGCRIFVDTRIEVGHKGEIEIGREQFLTELAKRRPPEYAMRLIVNKRMQLPTVSPSRARELLGWAQPAVSVKDSTDRRLDDTETAG